MPSSTTNNLQICMPLLGEFLWYCAELCFWLNTVWKSNIKNVKMATISLLLCQYRHTVHSYQSEWITLIYKTWVRTIETRIKLPVRMAKRRQFALRVAIGCREDVMARSLVWLLFDLFGQNWHSNRCEAWDCVWEIRSHAWVPTHNAAWDGALWTYKRLSKHTVRHGPSQEAGGIWDGAGTLR